MLVEFGVSKLSVAFVDVPSLVHNNSTGTFVRGFYNYVLSLFKLTYGLSFCKSKVILTWYIDGLTTYTFFSTGETRSIKFNLTCETKNLIYMIQCNRCNLQYIGESKRRFCVVANFGPFQNALIFRREGVFRSSFLHTTTPTW